MNSISGLGQQAEPDCLYKEKHGRRHHNTKTDVVVPVVRVVPVAVRAAHVPLIIVERAAAQHTGIVFGQPRQRTLALALYTALLFSPASQQFADFFDHHGYVFILPFIEELQADT